MGRHDPNGPFRAGVSHALLATALVAATALVWVPLQVYAVGYRDLAGSSLDVLLAVLAAGLSFFLVLALVVLCVPSRFRGYASSALLFLATWGWTRAVFFPGPSLDLDGGHLTTSLGTGTAGLVVPLTGALVLTSLGRRRPRVVSALLTALVAGSLLQSATVVVAVWRAVPPAPDAALSATLEWSRRGNVLVVILDSLQSDVFGDLLVAQPGLSDRLDGFRYYRRASSSSPTTYLSLPTIHSGEPYDPNQSVADFYRKSLYEGSVLNRFADAGYRVSYAWSVGGCPASVDNCLSTAELARSRRAVAVQTASRLIALGVYRVLPDALRTAVLEPGGLGLGQARLDDRPRTEADALEHLATSSRAADSPPTVKFVHSQITHRPTRLQPDCSEGAVSEDREGAVRQASCAFAHLLALFDRLKSEGVYDVSDIILAADHGYGFESALLEAGEDPAFARVIGALNPVVLVKPAGARGRMTTSDAAIELADLPKALCQEPGCSPAAGLRRLDVQEAGRPREAFWYSWKHEYWTLPRIPGLVRYSVQGDPLDLESWRRDAADYVPGTVIDFRRGRQNSSPYLGFGWAPREPLRQRMVDRRARLWLRLQPAPIGDCVLVLTATLAGTSPARVAVEVNGVEIGELAPQGPDGAFRTYRLTVTRATLARATQTVITFSSLGTGPDSGRPGPHLALQTLELRPL